MRRLDAKLAAVSESFLRDTTTLIVSYENAGQFDRAKLILEVLQKLDPKNEAIQTKLKSLNERIMEATLQELDLDADAQWTPVGRVVKGRPIRIEATGEYKVTATVETGPAGLPSVNPVTDMVAGVPLGGLMGVILPAAAPTPPEGQPAQANQQAQQPRPFPVGAAYDRPADRDGILYLKVNVPPGSKCTGQLRARLSGADKSE
ncbi:hypothetical protein EBR04_02940 [bacterium]|nr:hypothetical protein [bacterium]